jgi:hypothetical protein
MKKLAETEAVFGSVCRGDVDGLSDRDILVVDANTRFLRERRSELENEGWSVATYTWKKLERLSAQGALFLQHLKLESQILNDQNNKFSSLLEDFRPKKSYAFEILQNAKLATISRSYPPTTRGALWAADVAYVCARNFGVLRLAEKGKFCFSAKEISEELVQSHELQMENSEVLTRLRRLKSYYRGGAANADEPVENILERAHFAFPNVLSDSKPIFPLKILQEMPTLPEDASPYHRLRKLEKMYLCLETLDRTLVDGREFLRLRNWIKDPRQYASFASRNEERFLKTIAAQLSRVDLATIIVPPGIKNERLNLPAIDLR